MPASLFCSYNFTHHEGRKKDVNPLAHFEVIFKTNVKPAFSEKRRESRTFIYRSARAAPQDTAPPRAGALALIGCGGKGAKGAAPAPLSPGPPVPQSSL